jgi:GGDEF domain-containing protein
VFRCSVTECYPFSVFGSVEVLRFINVTATFRAAFHDTAEHSKGNILLDQAVRKVTRALCGGGTRARYGRTCVLMFLESSNYHCNAAYRTDRLLASADFEENFSKTWRRC